MANWNWSSQSRHERGYGKEWVRQRKLAMERDYGLCQCDKCKGYGLMADHVHHIVSMAEGKRLGWGVDKIHHIDNLISMNKKCHDREHGFPERMAFREDGYPVE